MGMDVGAKKGPRSDINITPLVDVVLVLLIIFMVLTPLAEKQMDVRVPDQIDPKAAPPPPPDPNMIQYVFHVAADGSWLLNNEKLTEDAAPAKVKGAYNILKNKQNTDPGNYGAPVIFFDVEDKAKYVDAVKALDMIRSSSPSLTIGMMTEKTNEPPPGAPAPGAVPGAPAPDAPPPAPTPQ